MKHPAVRLRAVITEEADLDTESFVAAVIRSHENVLRSLRRLAGGAVWPVEGDPRRDRWNRVVLGVPRLVGSSPVVNRCFAGSVDAGPTFGVDPSWSEEGGEY